MFLIFYAASSTEALNTVLGFYEYQTGATERMGEILEILPHQHFKKYSKEYSKTTLIDSGTWAVKNDTLFLQSANSLVLLKIKSENQLRSFLPDSLENDLIKTLIGTIKWTKTKGYYENGSLESIRKWESISWYSNDAIPYGSWIYYYDNHNIKAVGRFKKAKKKGKWFYFDRNGNEIDKK